MHLTRSKCALLFIDYLRIYTNLYIGQHLSALYTPIDEGNIRRVRKLRLDEYSSSFLSWAQRYLQQDPRNVIDGGVSLTDLMIQKIAGRPRTAQLKLKAAKREKKRQRLIEQPGEPVT